MAGITATSVSRALPRPIIFAAHTESVQHVQIDETVASPEGCGFGGEGWGFTCFVMCSAQTEVQPDQRRDERRDPGLHDERHVHLRNAWLRN